MNYPMKFQRIRKIFFLLFFFIPVFQVSSKELLKKPVPFRLVVDLAGVLSPVENESLNTRLRLFDDSSSTQICIVIDKSLEGEDLFDYSFRIAREWGIGQKDKNNGLLVYLAIKEKRSIIQVGYGLEGIIPDAAAKGIIEDYMVPQFRKGNYYAGLDTAASILMGLARKDYPASKYFSSAKHKDNGSIIVVLIIFAIIIFSMIFRNRNNNNRTSGWGPFTTGTGTFGGFGGGGFSGGGGGFSGGSFGGGSFGGGGASGGW